MACDEILLCDFASNTAIGLFFARAGTQDQLAVTHRYAIARIVIHAHLAFFLAEPVTHVVTHLLFLLIDDSRAALLGSRIGIVLLHSVLNAVARVSAGRGPADFGDLLALSTADLIAEHATHHRADHGARDVVRITRRL